MLKKITGHSALFCLFLSTGHCFEKLDQEERVKCLSLPLRIDANIRHWLLQTQSSVGMRNSKEVFLRLESTTDQVCLKEVCLSTSTHEIVTLSVTSYRDEPRLQTILSQYRHPTLPNQWICRDEQQVQIFLNLLRSDSLVPSIVLDVFSRLLEAGKRSDRSESR